MKRGGTTNITKKMKEGDIMWFIVNKINGGKSIAVAEYTGKLYDRRDEPLTHIYTLTNKEQGWIGNEPWDIQIYYRNLYMIEHANIDICLRGAWSIMYYDSVKNNIHDNLPDCFQNIKRYCVPR